MRTAGVSGTTIDNAIKRGQGLSLSGNPLETVFIEGMAHNGVSFIM
jgi:transcriptional/translational regulatory protein YebC/TACO1